MQKWGFTGDVVCTFCRGSIEVRNHIFTIIYLMSNVKTYCDWEDSWHGVLKISEKKASEIPNAE